jgi:hypothetical protein
MNTQTIVFEQDNKQVIQVGSKFFTRVFAYAEIFESQDFNTLERAKESLGIAPTISESNKLIAEFMQYEFFDGDFKVPHTNKTSNSDFKEWCPTYWNNDLDSGGYLVCPSNLIFHSDWNWLMEVVEKIESLGVIVEIRENVCYIETSPNNYYSELEDTKLQATYKAVVEYIKWYNNQTN